MPSGLVLAVVGEKVHDVLIDFVKGEHLGGAAVNGHVDHGYVAKIYKTNQKEIMEKEPLPFCQRSLTILPVQCEDLRELMYLQ